MELSDCSESWLKTSQGVQRGYIDARGLEELWFHTGTRCNLSCPFCLEGSNPSSDRLSYITLDDARPYIEEALLLDVQKFSFTGGEPFLNPDFIKILALASSHRPCLVLSNGTKPFHLKWSKLNEEIQFPERIRFRISLDFSNAEQHDRSRGEGSFKLALEALKKLQDSPFSFSVAVQWPKGENKEAITHGFESLFETQGIRSVVPLVLFPDFGTPGLDVQVPEITEDCMTRYQSEETRAHFMCSFSRMVIKRNNQLVVSACTLVDDDPEYDLSSTLSESLSLRVRMRHHRCFSCFSCGSSCSE